MLIYFAIAVGACTLMCCAWVNACNNRTHLQLTKLITYIYNRPDWDELSRKFAAVDYFDHMWALVFFRDPRDLYDFDIPDEVLK